jgi:hypothetical protein
MHPCGDPERIGDRFHGVSSRPGKGACKAVFLAEIQRLAQDLILQRLFAEHPLQLTDLALQGAIFGGRDYLLAGAHRRRRAFGIEPSPAKK